MKVRIPISSVIRILLVISLSIIVLTLTSAVVLQINSVAKPARARLVAEQTRSLNVSPVSGRAYSQATLTSLGHPPGAYEDAILWDGNDKSVFDISKARDFPIPFTTSKSASPGNYTNIVCIGSHCFTSESEQNASTPFEVMAVSSEVVQDFYYANGQRITVTIPLDEVGVIAREGVSVGRIVEFGAEFGLQLTEEVPDQMFLLGLSQPLERNNLVQFVREVRREGQTRQLLLDAGLIIRSTGEPALTPMLASDEFIALFKSEVNREQIDELNQANHVEIMRRDPFVANQFILRVTQNSPVDALTMANQYEENELTVFAHADFWVVYERFETIPIDPLFGNQWHHRNTGASSGVIDADADTTWAWDITTGSNTVLIAVLDDSMELTHEDLAPNLFTNPGEIPGNGIDDDGNMFIDDVNGWDFRDNDNDPSPGSATDNHGTAVAGVAAARANNTLGVAGSCPNCRILPIRLCCTNVVSAYANAFAYAQAMGADIINNSWGSNPALVVPTAIANAINNAAAAGSIIFFAAGNGNSSGWCANSYPSLDSVIAVSSSTNQDRKVVESAFGNCVDILAPSHRGYVAPYNGTLNVTTTDRTGAPGYNSASPPPLTCPIAEPANTNYTHCFGGTSSASPLAAGIAGLIRSVNTTMSRVEVQRLIQDTADKIIPSVANYSAVNGFSSPPSGVATHSWGRINAYEAVRIAAPVDTGGKSGVDIFVRDNYLDWGNTTGYQNEQNSGVLFESPRGFIPWWQSVDIKIDSPAGGYQPTPTTSAQFDALVDENPHAGEMNRVYVRVRNRGPVTANAVTVKLHWTFAGTGLPALPADFWTAFPADSSDTSQIHPLGTASITNLAYSGGSIAGTASDAAQIVQFDFPGPAIDPNQPQPDHFCLFAVIASLQDPVDPTSKTRFVIDNITPNDNNITHRNVSVQDTSGSSRSYQFRFYIRNPYSEPIQTRLLLHAPEAQQDWKIDLDRFGFDRFFSLGPNEEVLVTITTEATEPGQSGEVTVIQERLDTPVEPEVLGGMTFLFEPRTIEMKQYLPLVSN